MLAGFTLSSIELTLATRFNSPVDPSSACWYEEALEAGEGGFDIFFFFGICFRVEGGLGKEALLLVILSNAAIVELQSIK